MNSEKIAKNLGKSYALLDEVIIDNIGNVAHELSSISHVDNKYEEILKTVNDAYYSLKEAQNDISANLEDIDFDESEQSKIEERLDTIFLLKRKGKN